MNSLERLIASGRGQPLDCVPVAPGIGHYAAVKAGQPMTKVTWNPELMAEEEFSFFYLEQLIRHLKRLGSLVLLHICNDTTRLLNRMVEIGADILSLDVQVDLAEAKRLCESQEQVQLAAAS